MKRIFTFFAAIAIACGMFAQKVALNPEFKATTTNLSTNPAKDGTEITWLTSQTEATSFGNPNAAHTMEAVMEFTMDDILDYDETIISSISQVSFFLNSQYVNIISGARVVILQGSAAATATEALSQDVEASSLTSGWNSVELTAPYTVNSTQNLYIGFEVTTTSGGYPVSVAACTNAKQAWFNSGGWSNMVTDMGYNYGFMIKATATLSPVGDLAIRLASLDLPTLALVDTDLTVKGTVVNRGADNITSFSASYTINGTTQEQDFSGLNIAPMANYDFEFTAPHTLDQPVTYEITVTVSNPNGEEDNDADNTLTASIDVLSSMSVTKRILHEVFSSSTCPPCLPGNQALKAVLDAADPERYVYLKYQMNWPGTGDPYYTAEGGQKRTYYGITGVPDMFLDGTTNIFPPNYTLAQFNALTTIPAKAEMSATASRNDKTISAEITITPVMGGNNNLRLFAAIVEKTTTKNKKSNGETIFYNVMKKFMTAPSGNTLATLTAGEPVVVPLSYTFNGEYRLPADANSPINHATEHSVENFENLAVVYWIQNTVTKEVWQAGTTTIINNVSQYEVTYQQPENGELTVTADGATVESGALVNSNTELIITATPAEGYEIGTLTVNGEAFTSGETHTVVGDVTIVCTMTSGVDKNTLSGIAVYGKGSAVNIVNNNNIRLQSVQIIDMAGRTVYASKSVTSNAININAASGHYVVKLISEDGKVSTSKIYLSK